MYLSIYNVPIRICFVKCCRSSAVCTPDVQNNQKHFSDVVSKPNRAHLALAARFCSETSATLITSCSKVSSGLLHEAIQASLSKLLRPWNYSGSCFLFFLSLTYHVSTLYFISAIGGQHDGHLPFWLPGFVGLIMLLLPVLFALK